jgi:hypothetical protein
MPYYTLHMHMDAHAYVYHRNIHIQHCVREVVRSKYPGKKQRVNIRIKSDRKNNFFLTMYTLNKNPFHLKNCVIYKSALDA